MDRTGCELWESFLSSTREKELFKKIVFVGGLAF